jgi:hypothetical protein
LPANRRSDLVEKLIIERLQKAAGANYDKEQNASPSTVRLANSEFVSYKNNSKKFFQERERQGNVTGVVYETKPLSKATPLDLNNRSMTVGAATARANIVDLVTRNQIQE